MIDVPPPLKDCVPPAAIEAPTIVIELAPVFRVMLLPATRTIEPVLNAPAVPRAETTAALLDAEIVILDAPLAKLIFAPATRLTLDEEALSEKLVAAGTVGPIIVIVEATLVSVMFAPATNEALFVIPLRVKLPPPPPPEMIISGTAVILTICGVGRITLMDSMSGIMVA